MRRLNHLLVIVLLVLPLASCGEVADGLGQQPGAMPTATPTPTATATPSPTATMTVTPLPATHAPALDATACPVTLPPDPPFVPPPPYTEPVRDGSYWYGSASLWTQLKTNGSYDARDFWKMFWWRDGYSWVAEPQPDLTVTATRIDAAGPVIEAGGPATNAYSEDIGSAMLVGLRFPSPGCWEITGVYDGHPLTVVAWIATAPAQ